MKREKKRKEKENKDNSENMTIQAKAGPSFAVNQSDDNIDDIFTPKSDCLSDLDPFDRDVELFKQFCIGNCYASLIL